mgnify:CR=1 FL=1
MQSSISDVMQETEKETLNSDSIVANSDLQDFREGDPKNNAGPSDNNDRQGESSEHNEQHTPITQKKTFQRPRKKNSKKIYYDDKLREIENKKLSFFQERAHNVEDNDYQFLVSLLPYLHEVPAQNKLRVRMEMMNVLLTEQAERNNLRQPISNL